MGKKAKRRGFQAEGQAGIRLSRVRRFREAQSEGCGGRSESESRRSQDAGGEFPRQIPQNSFGKTSLRRIFNLSKSRSNLCNVKWCSPRSMRCRVVCERPVFLANWAYDRLPLVFLRNLASSVSKFRRTWRDCQKNHHVCVMTFSIDKAGRRTIMRHD